jgi:serine/threonine protein kinase
MATDPSSTPGSAGDRFSRVVNLGRYEILAHIATGGMGAVYRARDPVRGSEVAIKVMPQEMATRPGALERFRQEALNAARLQHENIVSLHDFGEHQGVSFLVMEYVDGTDLHEHVEKHGRLDPAEARFIIGQAIKALHHAHKRGIVHRDIKPSNFLLTRKGGKLLVKLTDFGLSRQVDDDEFRVTREGTTVGTVDYMAPEQARDSRAADVRSDIYSLGCTLYFMLTGKPPFPEGTLPERIFKHAEAEPADVRTFNRRVPGQLVQVLRRMLAKDPTDRYQTPRELLQALIHGEPEKVDGHDALLSLAEMEVMEGKKDRSRSVETLPSAPRTRPVREPEPRSVREPGVEHHPGPGLLPAQKASQKPKQPAKDRRKLLLGIGLATALGALVVIGLAMQRSGRQVRPASPERRAEVNPIPLPVPGPPEPEKEKKPVPGQPPMPPDPPRKVEPPTITWPPLLGKKQKAVRADFRRSFLSGWDNEPGLPADAPVVRVRRNPAAGEYTTLAEAARAPLRKGAGGPLEPATVVLEVADNGPLYEEAAFFQGKNVVVRAAPGYCPLILWVPGQPEKKKPAVLFSVSGGSLTLEGLDLVLSLERPVSKRPVFARVSGGNLLARRCTFSVAGTLSESRPDARPLVKDSSRRAGPSSESRPDGVIVASIEEGAERRDTPARCRLHRCQTRGRSLVPLALAVTRSDVLIDECLLVGGDLPLLDFRAPSGASARLRLLRSTLVAGDTCLRLRTDGGEGVDPDLQVTAWDTLLTHPGRSLSGSMLDVGNLPARSVHWEAFNCLYAGWEYLLKAREPVPAGEGEARDRWCGYNRDRVLAEGWPAARFPELAVIPAAEYRTDLAPGLPVGFRSTSFPILSRDEKDPGKGPPTMGCPVAHLLPACDNWPRWTIQQFDTPMVDLLTDAEGPAIPVARDGFYHGERIDITRMDVGARLDQARQQARLGPRVVLHLFRSGDQRTVPSSPIRVKGRDLVLVLEPYRKPRPPEMTEPGNDTPVRPPTKDEPQRLVLEASSNARDAQALIEVEDGNLEMIGGEVRFPDFHLARVPSWAVRVKGGNLRLHDCWLQGPLFNPPEHFRGLICFQGMGVPGSPEEDDRTPQCALHQTVLSSGHAALLVQGVGARLRLRQCVLVAGTDALSFEPGPEVTETSKSGAPKGGHPPRWRMSLHCLLERVTVAGGVAAVHLCERPRLQGTSPRAPGAGGARGGVLDNSQSQSGPPADPIILQPRSCVFLNPFGRKAGLLIYDGKVLQQGIFLWQGEGNVYDRRLHFPVAAAGTIPEKPQPLSTWVGLWGPAGDRRPFLDVPVLRQFDRQRWPLERLQLIPPRFQRFPFDVKSVGADLVQLGIVRKPPGR